LVLTQEGDKDIRKGCKKVGVSLPSYYFFCFFVFGILLIFN
jgi:hypothetical protein